MSRKTVLLGALLLAAATPIRGPVSTQVETAPPISRVLEEMLSGRASPENLLIEAFCSTDEGFRSVTVFGNGVAIWNRERQFSAEPGLIRAMLEAFKRADFGALDETYGGDLGASGSREGVRRQPSAIRLTCSVRLAIDDTSKEVRQYEGGEQSQELRRLANEILALSAEPARSGVTAASLTRGLRMIVDGALAPETLEVLVHRKIGDRASEQKEEGHGWLLKVEAGVATTRLYANSTDLGDPLTMKLGLEELAGLALVLADNNLKELPVNLYAEHYTDLVVKVLNHEKTVQARQFAGTTPETYGENQAHFDRLLETMRRLHQQVLQAGDQAASKWK